MDDDGLLAALAVPEGVDVAFEALVRAYQDRIYAFAWRLAGNPQDAEEIAQDAFVRAYRALAGYPPERRAALALRPWLYRIALNVFRNRGRRRGAQAIGLAVGQPEADATEPAAAAGERPEAVVLRAETRAELAQLIARLPEAQRVALVLRHVEGFGYAEIAGLLDQPVGTVKANVHRGVRRLRDWLSAAAAADVVPGDLATAHETRSVAVPPTAWRGGAAAGGGPVASEASSDGTKPGGGCSVRCGDPLDHRPTDAQMDSEPAAARPLAAWVRSKPEGGSH